MLECILYFIVWTLAPDWLLSVAALNFFRPVCQQLSLAKKRSTFIPAWLHPPLWSWSQTPTWILKALLGRLDSSSNYISEPSLAQHSRPTWYLPRAVVQNPFICSSLSLSHSLSLGAGLAVSISVSVSVSLPGLVTDSSQHLLAGTCRKIGQVAVFSRQSLIFLCKLWF